MSNRSSIPEHVKRAVRQTCGFGCVICGHPIYDYDHIVPYSTNSEHAADNLALLCGIHHAEKTRGLIPTEAVIEARRNPANKRAGVSEVQSLHFSGKKCVIKLGNYVAENDLENMHGSFVAIVIANESLLGFRIEDEHLLLTMNLKDNYGNTLILIEDNEMIFKTDVFDLKYAGGRISIRREIRNMVASIWLRPPSEIVVERATFANHSFELQITPTYVSDRYGNKLFGARSQNVKYGVVLNSRDEFWPSLAFIESF